MHQKITSITQWWQLPSICVLCHHYHRNRYAVCLACAGSLSRIKDACKRCRLPLADGGTSECGYCIKEKPAFDQVLSAWSFEEPLRTLLHQFKYREALFLGRFMAQLMKDALPETPYRPDCLVPVPMHPQRLRQRGFNQATELAKLLAKELNIPVKSKLCKKIVNTEAQVLLDGKKRRQNLQKVFLAKPNHYQHVTLVDDLLTTGGTANALAIALKEQGVARVDVWCVARTPER